jgi:regulation of enolase protein 1 (concanavalin A-like superfamily)
MRYRHILLVGVILLAGGAAPATTDDTDEKLQAAYGTWTDPDRDCKYVLKGRELRISLPNTDHIVGKYHDRAKNNAPRILREVEGDFTAIVRVAFPIPKSFPEKFDPFCSGGLLAWESEDAYLAVRRCGGQVAVGGEGESIFRTYVTKDAIRVSGKRFAKPGEWAFIRLKREGNKVTAGGSRDGKKWGEFDSENVNWGAKIKVGVIAENSLDVPVEITFDQYSLSQPKK